MKSGGEFQITRNLEAIVTTDPVADMCKEDKVQGLRLQPAKQARVKAFCGKYKPLLQSDPKKLTKIIFSWKWGELSKELQEAIIEANLDISSAAAVERYFTKIQNAYWKLPTNRTDAPEWWKKANPASTPPAGRARPIKPGDTTPTPPPPVKKGQKEPKTGLLFYGDLQLGGVAWGQLCSSDDTSGCSLALVQGGFNVNLELGAIYNGGTFRAKAGLQLVNITSQKQPKDPATGERFGDRGLTYQPGLVIGAGFGMGGFTAMLTAGIHLIHAKNVPGSVTQYIQKGTYAGYSAGLELSYEVLRTGMLGLSLVLAGQFLGSFNAIKLTGTETTSTLGEFTVDHKGFQLRGGIRVAIGRLETKKQRYLRKTRERLERDKDEARKAQSLQKEIERLKKLRRKLRKEGAGK